MEKISGEMSAKNALKLSIKRLEAEFEAENIRKAEERADNLPDERSSVYKELEQLRRMHELKEVRKNLKGYSGTIYTDDVDFFRRLIAGYRATEKRLREEIQEYEMKFAPLSIKNKKNTPNYKSIGISESEIFGYRLPRWLRKEIELESKHKKEIISDDDLLRFKEVSY